MSAVFYNPSTGQVFAPRHVPTRRERNDSHHSHLHPDFIHRIQELLLGHVEPTRRPTTTRQRNHPFSDNDFDQPRLREDSHHLFARPESRHIPERSRAARDFAGLSDSFDRHLLPNAVVGNEEASALLRSALLRGLQQEALAEEDRTPHYRREGGSHVNHNVVPYVQARILEPQQDMGRRIRHDRGYGARERGEISVQIEDKDDEEREFDNDGLQTEQEEPHAIESLLRNKNRQVTASPTRKNDEDEFSEEEYDFLLRRVGEVYRIRSFVELEEQRLASQLRQGEFLRYRQRRQEDLQARIKHANEEKNMLAKETEELISALELRRERIRTLEGIVREAENQLQEVEAMSLEKAMRPSNDEALRGGRVSPGEPLSKEETAIVREMTRAHTDRDVIGRNEKVLHSNENLKTETKEGGVRKLQMEKQQEEKQRKRDHVGGGCNREDSGTDILSHALKDLFIAHQAPVPPSRENVTREKVETYASTPRNSASSSESVPVIVRLGTGNPAAVRKSPSSFHEEANIAEENVKPATMTTNNEMEPKLTEPPSLLSSEKDVEEEEDSVSQTNIRDAATTAAAAEKIGNFLRNRIDTASDRQKLQLLRSLAQYAQQLEQLSQTQETAAYADPIHFSIWEGHDILPTLDTSGVLPPGVHVHPCHHDFLRYESSLNRILQGVDQIESAGHEEVREMRKRLVEKVQKSLDDLDARKRDAWDKFANTGARLEERKSSNSTSVEEHKLSEEERKSSEEEQNSSDMSPEEQPKSPEEDRSNPSKAERDNVNDTQPSSKSKTVDESEAEQNSSTETFQPTSGPTAEEKSQEEHIEATPQLESTAEEKMLQEDRTAVDSEKKALEEKSEEISEDTVQAAAAPLPEKSADERDTSLDDKDEVIAKPPSTDS